MPRIKSTVNQAEEGKFIDIERPQTGNGANRACGMSEGAEYAKHFRPNSTAGVQRRDLKKLEATLGTELPVEIVSHYQSVNGGVFGKKCVFSRAEYTYTACELYPISNAKKGNLTVGELREAVRGLCKIVDWLVVFGSCRPNSLDDNGSLCDLAFSIRPKDYGAIYLAGTNSYTAAKKYQIATSMGEFVRGLKTK